MAAQGSSRQVHASQEGAWTCLFPGVLAGSRERAVGQGGTLLPVAFVGLNIRGPI